jgi:hypothetical protein
MCELMCLFCGKPAGDDAITDDAGEVACKECGEAEIKTQIKEGLWPPTKTCSENSTKR